MSLALATAALLLGLSGGPHCAAMCGSIQAGLVRRTTAQASARALAYLHLGRLIGYCTAGALVAASVSGLSRLGAAWPIARPFWTIAQVAALALGLALVQRGTVPAWIATLRWPVRRRSNTIRFMDRVPSGLRTAGAGACWAALPCGLLQSALIVAGLAGSAMEGAGIMGAFSAGTALSLTAVTAAWTHFGSRPTRRGSSTVPVRLAGAMLAASSAYAIYHGLGATLQAAVCT